MNVAIVAPWDQRCGIAHYSHRLAESLRVLGVTIEQISCASVVANPRQTARLCAKADLVHVQYEQSLFGRSRNDRFEPFARALKTALVTTVHEVYREFPWDFPRSRIPSSYGLGGLRRILYDIRHPAATAYRRLTRHSIFSRALLIHHRHLDQILIEQGCDAKRIHTVGYPHDPAASLPDLSRPCSSPVRLGALGFLGPGFDFDLLFLLLETLRTPWTFTWIGSTRPGTDSGTESALRTSIISRGWSDRFAITGWLNTGERNQVIDSQDIFLALFKYRSSSESLATLFSRGACVVATTNELVKTLGDSIEPPLCCCAYDKESLCETVKALLPDSQRISDIRQRAATFAQNNSAQEVARRTLAIYQSILNGQGE